MSGESLAAIVGVFLVAWIGTPAFRSLDDAYIALHSARVLIMGADPIFGVPALVGSASPPLVVLLAGLLSVQVPGLIALRLVSVAGFASLLLATWWLTEPLIPMRRVCLTAIAGIMLWAPAVRGLEMGWVLAVAIWGLAAVAHDRPWIVAVAAGLLASLRPDLIPAAGAIWLMGAARQSWPMRARMAGVALLVLAPWPVLLYANTGHWLPTMAAKQAFFAESCAPLGTKVGFLARGLGQFGIVVLPLTLGLMGLPSTATGRLGILAMLSTFAAYALLLPSAVYLDEYRYPVAISAPWLVFGLTTLAIRRPSDTVTAAGLVTVLLALLWQPPYGLPYATELQNVTGWIEAHTNASDTLLVHDAGAISELSHRRAVDLVGLKTPSSIQVHQAVTLASCGTERPAAVGQIAKASGASYVVVSKDWDRLFHLTDGIRSAGGSLIQVRPYPPVWGYDVYRLSFK